MLEGLTFWREERAHCHLNPSERADRPTPALIAQLFGVGRVLIKLLGGGEGCVGKRTRGGAEERQRQRQIQRQREREREENNMQ